ncbi:MAG: MucR family transcriptional regulator [Desulfobaccales bacterium]
MASEILKLTAEIVASHASMTGLTTTELVKEIKEVYSALSSLAGEVVVPVPESAMARSAGSLYQKPRSRKMLESLEAKAVEEEAGPVLGDPDYLEFMESREG